MRTINLNRRDIAENVIIEVAKVALGEEEDDEQNNCFDCEIEDQAMTMSYSACEDGILTYTVNGITERETWTSNFDSFEDLKKSLNLLGCEL